MAIAPLPPGCDVAALKTRLLTEHRIEIPCFAWQGRPLLRISVQGYNPVGELDQLVKALQMLLQDKS